MIIIVMGVSGSGKSTIGALLASRLGCGFSDADDFHPAANAALDRLSGGYSSRLQLLSLLDNISFAARLPAAYV